MASSDYDSDALTAEGIAAAGYPPHLIDQLVDLFEISVKAIAEKNKEIHELEQKVKELKIAKQLLAEKMEEERLEELEMEKLQKETEPSTSTNDAEEDAKTN